MALKVAAFVAVTALPMQFFHSKLDCHARSICWKKVLIMRNIGQFLFYTKRVVMNKRSQVLHNGSRAALLLPYSSLVRQRPLDRFT